MFEFVQDDEKRMPKVRKAPQTFTEALYNLGEILYGKTPEREVRGGWDERPEMREQEHENYGFEIPPYVPERIPAMKNDDLWYHVAQRGDPQPIRKVEEKPIYERVYPSQTQNSDLYGQPRISKGQNTNPDQPSPNDRYMDNQIDKDWAQEIKEQGAEGLKQALYMRSKTSKEDEQTKEDIKKAVEQVERYSKHGRKFPLNYLVHFLSGTGEPLEYNGDRAHELPGFDEAKEQNIKKMEDWLLSPNTAIGKQIKNLNEGEEVKLQSDRTEGTSGRFLTVHKSRAEPYIDNLLGTDGILGGSAEQSLSTGTIQIAADTFLTAKRQGNEIIVEGRIRHHFNDVFDFNAESPDEKVMFETYKHLEEKGIAKRFNIRGEKIEPYKAVFYINPSNEIEKNDTKNKK